MFEKAAMRLYEARLARKEAKEAFIKFREEFSACELLDGPHASPCYGDEYTQMPKENWCDVCKKGQPFYLARKSACKEVGMAMRALMQLCKKSAKP